MVYGVSYEMGLMYIFDLKLTFVYADLFYEFKPL